MHQLRIIIDSCQQYEGGVLRVAEQNIGTLAARHKASPSRL
jgi:hypothetical protein